MKSSVMVVVRAALVMAGCRRPEQVDKTAGAPVSGNPESLIDDAN